MGFRMVWNLLFPDDLQGSKVKVKPKNFEVKYIEKDTR